MELSVGKESRPFIWALINRYHQGSIESLIKTLPPNLSEMLLEEPSNHKEITPFLTVSPEHFLLIHPSWLATHLRKIGSPLKLALIASISEALHVPLIQELQLNIDRLPKLSERLQETLRHTFWNQIKPVHILPFELLQESPFLPVLVWEPDYIDELINTLGLYDLATTLKHIVDKKRLQGIYTTLSPDQQSLLRRLNKQRDQLKVPPIDLTKWEGDPTWLKQQLYRRGLFRIGRALYQQSEDLLWYFYHRFDKPKAQVLLNYAKQPTSPSAHELLVHQVVEQIQHIQTKITS